MILSRSRALLNFNRGGYSLAHNSASAVKAALVANGLIAAMKLIAAIMSGSFDDG